MARTRTPTLFATSRSLPTVRSGPRFVKGHAYLIMIGFIDQGKSVTVTVTDRCTGCDVTSLDFTPTAFQNMADLSVGRLYGMTWVWSS